MDVVEGHLAAVVSRIGSNVPNKPVAESHRQVRVGATPGAPAPALNVARLPGPDASLYPGGRGPLSRVINAGPRPPLRSSVSPAGSSTGCGKAWEAQRAPRFSAPCDHGCGECRV
jgi:hypothetical protein